MKPRNTVAYCRISTLEQKRKGYGIEIQVRDVTLFAQSQGFFIQRFYRDEGESGVEENRTALRRLLRDCEAGSVGSVLIPSLDRLSRDVRIAENLFYKFDKCGVRVLIADMPTYNAKDRKDVLIRQIREAIAEENRKDIIERLLKGRQERVRRGLPPGGTVPYGYKRNGKSLVVNPQEAEAVRLILALGDRAELSSAIARALNNSGFQRRNGKPWTRRQVAAVREREVLYRTGAIRYGEAKGISGTLVLK